jgi:hypothetical protein
MSAVHGVTAGAVRLSQSRAHIESITARMAAQPTTAT